MSKKLTFFISFFFFTQAMHRLFADSSLQPQTAQTLSISILTTEAEVIYLKELIAETQIVKYNEHGGVRAVRGLQFHSSVQPYLKSSNCITFGAQHCHNEKKSRRSHLALCPYLTQTMKPSATQVFSVCAENISDQTAA